MKRTFLGVVLLIGVIGCGKGGNSNTPEPVQNGKATIGDATLFEGNGGTTGFEFTVTLDKALSKEATVTYSTQDGTAKSSEDFAAVTAQSLTFQPNETSKKIIINVVADDAREGEDVFTVVLTGGANTSLQKATGAGTIRNDDTRVPFTDSGYQAPTSYAGYNLIWRDEFDNNAWDANAWKFQPGDGCPNLCGWGNNELEYYTDRPANLFFQDGKLIIEARKENMGGRDYTSAKIVTEGKKSFKFGHIDIRAKLPVGKGIWPAFWLMPQSSVYGGWPRSGEIDFMEFLGHEPNKVYGTVHFGPGPGSTQINRSYTLPSGTFNDAFHVFSLEWKEDQIKWLVDGNLYSTVNKADIGAAAYPFNEAFYLIFNLAVGGNWPGNPDATTYFPQWLIVDYVRLYQ